jgi:hypothetical protein
MGRKYGARTLDLAPGSPSVKRAYLDRSPAGDGGLSPPRQCLVQVSGFQHPKTAYVLLGLYVDIDGDPVKAGYRLIVFVPTDS